MDPTLFCGGFTGNIHYHNPSVHETLGYRQRVSSEKFFDYIRPETETDLKKKFTLSQKRAFTENVEFQFLCKDGTFRFLEFNAINLKHKEGFEGFILDCRDIAQRKESEAELVRLQKAKEQFLANMSHEIRTPITYRGDGHLLGQNPSPIGEKHI